MLWLEIKTGLAVSLALICLWRMLGFAIYGN